VGIEIKNGQVICDPEEFKWYPNMQGPQSETAITINKRDIRIFSPLGWQFASLAEKCGDGYYHVKIGVLPNAIAIRPSTDKNDWRVRQYRGYASLLIACSALSEELRKMGWKLPVKLKGMWDQEKGILIGIKES